MQVEFIQAVPNVHYTERIPLRRMRNRIRELRESRGWTLEQLAERMECSLPQLQKMETGERRLNDKWVDILCNIFSCKPGELYNAAQYPGSYKVDLALMQQASLAIEASARATGHRLTLPQAMAFTVELYNQAMEYRMQGKPAEVSEFTATLIINRAAK